MNDRKPMQLRLPTHLAEFIRCEAQENYTSRNAEVVRAVMLLKELKTLRAAHGDMTERAALRAAMDRATQPTT